MGTTADQSTGWDTIDGLYDVSIETMGSALEFRIFDPQNCDSLDEDWLAAAVASSGIDRAELDDMLREGLLHKWRSPAGKEGFLLYSEKQASMIKKLRDSRRYSLDELRHIVNDWTSYLQIVVTDDSAYDSFDVDDYDHFRRRAAEMVAFFEEDLTRDDDWFPSLPAEQIEDRKKEGAHRLRMWRWIHGKVANCSDSNLPQEIQKTWRRQLFHLRWTDEWVRLMTADEFSTQIELGYSPEITFFGHEWREGVTTLKNLRWDITLKRFKETRNEGKLWPLRTPDFNVTERGIEFLKAPAPSDYAALHEKYDLGRLAELLEEHGETLWTCDLSAMGRGECAECRKIFERTSASRKFCSDRCRNKAKARRWREADPDRARQAQAKHYREAYPEGRGGGTGVPG